MKLYMGNIFEVKGEMSAKQQKRDIAEKSKIKGEFTQNLNFQTREI